MYFDFLLDKNDSTCLSILSELAQEPTHSLGRQTLIDQFGLSSFRLNNYFETINADLASISDGEPPRYLEEAVKGIFRAHNVNTLTIQKMTLLYFKRSMKFSVFEYYFLFDQLLTTKQYQANHYLTPTVFYRMSNQLKKDCETLNFYSVADINQEREFIIRLRLFQLYYTVYSGIESFHPEFDSQEDQILALFEKYLVNQPQATQQIKLGVLIKIWLMRLNNKHQMKQVTLGDDVRDATYQALQRDLQALLGDQFDVDNAEMDYLYSFLITQGFVRDISDDYIEANFPKATKISRDFIAFFKTKNFIDQTTNIKSTGLYHCLLRVNLQFTLFYVEPTTFIDAKKAKFFRHLYPTFDFVIRAFLQQLKQESVYDLSDRQIINLYFSYMFSLINKVPARLVSDKVAICVDFSEGTLYSEYVMRSLAAFNHAHIIVQPYVDENTDIYISDFYSDKFNVAKVIWTDPPTAQDWSDLADLILRCKQARLARLYPDYDWQTRQFKGE